MYYKIKIIPKVKLDHPAEENWMKLTMLKCGLLLRILKVYRTENTQDTFSIRTGGLTFTLLEFRIV